MQHLSKRALVVALLASVSIVPLAGAFPLPDVLPGNVSGAVPGLWTSYNADWAAAPGGGEALRMSTEVAGYGYATLGFAPGVQIEDIDALSFDTFYEVGGCGGGSPRVTFVVDKDGDLDRDGAVHVYAGPFPGFSGCSIGVWQTNDLRDGAPRWESQSLGGPWGGDQASAQTAAGPAHQILRAVVVWDSSWMFPENVVFFDNIQIDCYALGERADGPASLGKVC